MLTIGYNFRENIRKNISKEETYENEYCRLFMNISELFYDKKSRKVCSGNKYGILIPRKGSGKTIKRALGGLTRYIREEVYK